MFEFNLIGLDLPLMDGNIDLTDTQLAQPPTPFEFNLIGLDSPLMDGNIDLTDTQLTQPPTPPKPTPKGESISWWEIALLIAILASVGGVFIYFEDRLGKTAPTAPEKTS